jgi:hypothetical protein
VKKPSRSRSLAKAGPNAVRPGDRDFFGPAPLIPGEEASAYQALLDNISAAVRPADMLEEILARDVVYLVWEAERLRRLKASLLQAAAFEGVKKIAASLISDGPFSVSDTAQDLSERWARREPKALKEVESLLTSAGLTLDAVMAQTLALNLDDVERIERMISSAEARRNNALHEIDRRRSALGAALRAAIEGAEGAETAEDAEFTDVETNATANGAAQ